MTAIVHLGMSGRLRVVSENLPVGKHDHVDFRFEGDRVLRLNDPRRFGSIHFSDDPVEAHWLIKNLGPEPLSRDFSGEHMHRLSRRRHQAVKMFIMNAQVVVGVGNIYANEALYRAGIRPRNAAGRVSKARYLELESAIRSSTEIICLWARRGRVSTMLNGVKGDSLRAASDRILTNLSALTAREKNAADEWLLSCICPGQTSFSQD